MRTLVESDFVLNKIDAKYYVYCTNLFKVMTTRINNEEKLSGVGTSVNLILMQ